MASLFLSTFLLIISVVLQFSLSSDEADLSLPKCSESIFENKTSVPDDAFFSSSDISSKHQAYHARYSSKSPGWCPSNGFNKDLTEYVEVDLGRIHLIKSIIFLVKSYSKHEQELPQFVLQYKRERDGPWFRYADKSKTCILRKNFMLDIEDIRELDYPIVVRWFRIYPHVEYEKSETCISFGLYGCQTNILEYITPINQEFHPRVKPESLLDLSYDAKNILQTNSLSSIDFTTQCDIKFSNPILSEENLWLKRINGIPYLTSGLGKLTNYKFDNALSSSYYVGFNSSSNNETIRMIFRFDDIYKIDFISIHMVYESELEKINSLISVEAKIFPDIRRSIYDYLKNEYHEEFFTEMNYFELDSNRDWIRLKGQGENIGKFALLEFKLRRGWILIDEIYFGTKKAEKKLILPETTVVTETLPEITTDNLAEILQSSETLPTPVELAPFGQFAITAIMIICGFGIFLILSTIFACFMMKNRRSSYKRNISSDIGNCDTFSKINVSQTNQNPLLNFSDIQLLNQQQSLMSMNHGTGSTTTTSDSLFNTNNNNQTLQFPPICPPQSGVNDQNYFTLSPQQQLMLLIAANNQRSQNINHTGDNSSNLYASIRGDGSSEVEENNSIDYHGTMSPGNLRSASNMPLPNPPVTSNPFQNIYGNQSFPTISPSLAQAHLLSQGNFQVLPNPENYDHNLMQTMNSRNSHDSNMNPGIFSISQPITNNFTNNSSATNGQKPYLSYLSTLQIANNQNLVNTRNCDDQK